jgi:hypothetical protein
MWFSLNALVHGGSLPTSLLNLVPTVSAEPIAFIGMSRRVPVLPEAIALTLDRHCRAAATHNRPR